MRLLRPSVRHGLRLAVLAPLGLALAGCSWFGESYRDVKCPSTDIISTLGSVSRVRGEGGNFADLRYHAQLTGLKGICDVDDSGVTVKLTVSTLGEIGPAATERSADFPYFVTVTGPNDQVIAKQVMANVLVFPPNQPRAGATDQLTQNIPLRNPRDAGKYHVLLGFQLTPEELAYNRLHGDH